MQAFYCRGNGKICNLRQPGKAHGAKKCSKLKWVTKAEKYFFFFYYGSLVQLERLKSQRVVVKVIWSAQNDESLFVLFTSVNYVQGRCPSQGMEPFCPATYQSLSHLINLPLEFCSVWCLLLGFCQVKGYDSRQGGFCKTMWCCCELQVAGETMPSGWGEYSRQVMFDLGSLIVYVFHLKSITAASHRDWSLGFVCRHFATKWPTFFFFFFSMKSCIAFLAYFPQYCLWLKCLKLFIAPNVIEHIFSNKPEKESVA